MLANNLHAEQSQSIDRFFTSVEERKRLDELRMAVLRRGFVNETTGSVSSVSVGTAEHKNDAQFPNKTSKVALKNSIVMRGVIRNSNGETKVWVDDEHSNQEYSSFSDDTVYSKGSGDTVKLIHSGKVYSIKAGQSLNTITKELLEPYERPDHKLTTSIKELKNK